MPPCTKNGLVISSELKDISKNRSQRPNLSQSFFSRNRRYAPIPHYISAPFGLSYPSHLNG